MNGAAESIKQAARIGDGLQSSQASEASGNVRFWGRAEIKIDRSHGVGEYVEGFRCFLSMEGFSLEQINEAMSEACRVCRPSKVVAKRMKADEDIEDLSDGTYYSKHCGPPVGLILLALIAAILILAKSA